MAKTCILVAAGEFSLSPADADRIKEMKNALVIAVDGGFSYCRQMGIAPDVVVGDFDSLEEMAPNVAAGLAKEENFLDGQAAKKFCGALEGACDDINLSCAKKIEIIRLPKEKDDTDTLFALKLGLDRGCSFFELYCATGGRLDHTLANIQCLTYLKNRSADGIIFEKDGWMKVLQKETFACALDLKNEGQGGAWEAFDVSVFSLSDTSEGVSILGCKYCVENVTLTNDFPVGISNSCLLPDASISVKAGTLLIMGRRCQKRI